MAVSFVVMK